MSNFEEVKKVESTEINWDKIPEEAKKRILVQNSIMHVFKEEQFPGQDEPITYVLKEFSRKISKVIKPEGTYKVTEVIELCHNTKDY